MRYREKNGFDSIVAEEPRHALEAIAASLEEGKAAGRISLTLVSPKGKKTAAVGPDATLAQLAELAGLEEGVKFAHVGVPLGVFLTAEALEQKTVGSLIGEDGVVWGGAEIRFLGAESCVLNYLQSLLSELRGENCGRCVFCREGVKQVLFALNAATGGKANAGTLPLITELSDAMKEASYCLFGKAVGALVESAVAGFRSEFDDHIRRKRCEAGACRAYVTFHILPAKCVGCGDCEDVCEDDAIEGRSGFIYMIDNDECVKCGKCMEACEEGAIVTAGAIKPRTPDRLTRVGAWRGR